jgi:hypothetical protein
MKAGWYEVAAGDYADEWSFFIYAIAPSDGTRVYSVRVYPKGGGPQDCPGAPLYRTLGAALAAVPSQIEKRSSGHSDTTPPASARQA